MRTDPIRSCPDRSTQCRGLVRISRRRIPHHFTVNDAPAGRPFTHLPAQCSRSPPYVTPGYQRDRSQCREYHKRERERRNKHSDTYHSRQYLAQKSRCRRAKGRVVAGKFGLPVACRHSLSLRFECFGIALRDESHEQGVSVLQNRPLDQARMLAHQLQRLGRIEMRLL
jgi:hypothetical protein